MDKSVRKSPNERLADVRVLHRRQVTQSEVADELGVDHTVISHFDAGRRKSFAGLGRAESIDRYARALVKLTGRSADELGIADLLLEGVAA
ncbi:MAG: hypothetical protein AB7L91_06495 [Dehalococcoidia bacterium]